MQCNSHGMRLKLTCVSSLLHHRLVQTASESVSGKLRWKTRGLERVREGGGEIKASGNGET